MLKSKITFMLAFIFVLSLISGCAPVIEISACVEDVPLGFGWGLLHGIIAPFTFIISLFKDDVAIYAVNNTGGWYDFGFLIGATIIFGGSGRGAKRKC